MSALHRRPEIRASRHALDQRQQHARVGFDDSGSGFVDRDSVELVEPVFRAAAVSWIRPKSPVMIPECF